MFQYIVSFFKEWESVSKLHIWNINTKLEKKKHFRSTFDFYSHIFIMNKLDVPEIHTGPFFCLTKLLLIAKGRNKRWWAGKLFDVRTRSGRNGRLVNKRRTTKQ